jgi:CheY-like chemotaxis protein
MDNTDSEPSCTLEITDESFVRVLHVDDDACILRISKTILEMKEGYQVDTALSAGEALKKWGKRNMMSLLAITTCLKKTACSF